MVNFKAIPGGRDIILYNTWSLVYVEKKNFLKAINELSKLKKKRVKRTNLKTSI